MLGPVVSMINDRAVLLLLFLHHAWLCYFCFSQDSNGLWYVAIENINYSTELSNHDRQVSVYWMYATQRYVVEEKKSKHLKEKEKWRMFVSTKGNLFWYGLLFWLSPIPRSAWDREWACFDFWMKFTWYAKFLILKAMDIVSVPTCEGDVFRPL